MLRLRTICCTAAAALVVASLASQASAQLNLEGQHGILYNPVPYTLKAGKLQAGARFVDASHLGSIQTYNVLYGWKGCTDIGYTRLESHIGGVTNQNIVSAKWNFLNDQETMAAASLWLLYRDLDGKGDDVTIGLNTAKVVKLGAMPLMVDLGARSSKARNAGLFGLASARKITWEASTTLNVLPTVVLCAEWRQQIDTPVWTNVGIRWDFLKNWDVAVGLNNLGPGLNRQLGVGITWKP